jgi:hypothetical protein
MLQHFLVFHNEGIAITEAIARSMDLVPCAGREVGEISEVYWVPVAIPTATRSISIRTCLYDRRVTMPACLICRTNGGPGAGWCGCPAGGLHISC